MAKVTNLDELKRQHEWARIAKVGGKEWIDFASTMIDSFPALYDTAKSMNKKMAEMQEDIDRLRKLRSGDAQEIEMLIGSCRQLHVAEQTQNQKDWTAVIRKLEKVGADSLALKTPNA